MLTLPLQRRMRNENSISSPTPPGTPLIGMSPRSMGEHTSGMLLTVDTRMNLESTPVKGSHSTGLLQIAKQSFLGPPTPSSMLSTMGHSTSEEKIGNLLLRPGNEVASLPSPNMRFQQRKYYGSLKKVSGLNSKFSVPLNSHSFLVSCDSSFSSHAIGRVLYFLVVVE